VITETKRRGSNRERILALLADRHEHTNAELLKVGGFRYSARIFELRQQGCVIEERDLGGGLHGYRLTQAPGERRPMADQRGQCLLLEVTSC
jgi:hypothetical protein